MQDDKSQLMNYAMHGGLFLGMFWVLKYLLVIASTRMPALGFAVSILSVGTLVIFFRFLVKYKTTITNNQMRYWHGVQFGIVLFFFASILECVIVFMHITWIDPAYVSTIYQNMIETLRALNLSENMMETFEKQPVPSNASYVFSSVITANVLSGLILSLILVPIARRYTPLNRKSSI